MHDTSLDTPKPKPRLRYWLLGIAALILLYITYLFFTAFTAKPIPKTDYATQINERTLKALNDVDGLSGRQNLPNAWADFVKLTNDFNLAQRNFEASKTPSPPNWPKETEWPDGLSDVDLLQASPEVAIAVKTSFARPDFINVFDRTKSLPDMRAWRTLPSGQPLVLVMLPELTNIRSLARACAQQMCLALRDKNNTSLVEWFERLLAVARIECSQSILIERLVGIAIIHLVTDRAQQIIATNTLDDATLAALDAALVRQLGATPKSDLTRIPTSAIWIENERTSFLDTVQWTHTDNGRGSGHLLLNRLDENVGITPDGYTKPRIINITGQFLASRKESVDIANRTFDETLALSKLTPFEAKSKPNPFEEVDKLSKRYLFLRLTLPALSSITRNDARTQLNVSALRIAIAIERHRLRTGTLPDTLEQLIPTELSEIPPDPFSSPGLKYKKFHKPDTQGRPYLLYTVGLDNTDNDAKELEANNRQYPITGRSEGNGYDHIIAPPMAGNEKR